MQLDLFLENDLPDMDPVISYGETEYGWRGLTSEGEIIEVRGTNGHKIDVPSSIVVASGGRAIGRRQVTNELKVDIDDYLFHFNWAIDCYKSNRLQDALEESESALRIAPTLRAKFNRAMILLAMGRWDDGLREYWECEQSKPFMRPQVEQALSAGLRPWKGEPITGKRLLLLHAHGFGDSIMMLRYVPLIKKAVMVMPPEMIKLASQVGRVSDELIDCDYFCPMLHLLHFCRVTPALVKGEPYLQNDWSNVDKWRMRLGSKRKIGLAWSVGKPSKGDYPREIELRELMDCLNGLSGIEFHSVQIQDKDEAERCGVIHHKFADFADCAAMMKCMDVIISVDTAALHLAGAIGHSRVTGLLSHWSSWRWKAKWYDNIKLCKQATEGDWASALESI